MGKKNRASIANPFMEIDGSFRRLRAKIGSFLSDMERHTFSPFNSIDSGDDVSLSLIKLLVNTGNGDLTKTDLTRVSQDVQARCDILLERLPIPYRSVLDICLDGSESRAHLSELDPPRKPRPVLLGKLFFPAIVL